MGVTDHRHLYVTWRQPNGQIVPVGRLTQLPGSHRRVSYEFAYLKVAERSEGFELLPGFPERYESARLFPLFANRQMPQERPDYDAFVRSLHLDAAADPFMVLERSEGMRATDRIEVFAAPTRTPDDHPSASSLSVAYDTLLGTTTQFPGWSRMKSYS